MCRFLLYLGAPVILSDLITEPDNSLIHQSFQSQERDEPLNGDGFGVAWYEPRLSPQPGLFRSVSPAWSNQNLRHLARITESPCVLAHVRAASDGLHVAEANCHPFVAGPFAFMHNGDLAGFQSQRRALIARLSDRAYNLIEGSTDSEFLFAYLLDVWQRLADVADRADRLCQALSTTIAEVVALTCAHSDEPSYLNIAVTDGQHAAVSRYTTQQQAVAETLHLHTGKVYRCVDGVCRLYTPESHAGAVIVSSEKLSDDPGWSMVPTNHLVLVQPDRSVQLRTLPAPAHA